MPLFSSCQEAIDSCLSTKTFAIAHLYKSEETMGIHIHDCYELYFSVSGGKQFLIDNKLYDVNPDDAFFINQFESHYLPEIDKTNYERVLIFIYPDYLKSISTSKTDLDACFRERPIGFSHKIHLNLEKRKIFSTLTHDFKYIPNDYGSDIMEQALFSMLIVCMSNYFWEYQRSHAELGKDKRCGTPIDLLLDYIDLHINSDLSLEELAEQIRFSIPHMCQTFKLATGTTIKQYIIARRIACAKQLLARGYNISEAYEQSGFGDYSNFYIQFKRATGTSPKNYIAQLHERKSQ